MQSFPAPIFRARRTREINIQNDGETISNRRRKQFLNLTSRYLRWIIYPREPNRLRIFVDLQKFLVDNLLVIHKQPFQLLGVGLRPVAEAQQDSVDHGLLLKDRCLQFLDARLRLFKDIEDCINIGLHLNCFDSMEISKPKQAHHPRAPAFAF
jgi:hypothetical protein